VFYKDGVKKVNAKRRRREIMALVNAMDELELKEGIIITEDKEGRENKLLTQINAD
jgi:hypothetical protein